MTNDIGSMDFIRYDQEFDNSKIPRIRRESGLLSLDPVTNPEHIMDELRVNNFMKNPPRPRQVPTIDEIELERLTKYGPRVDISAERIYQQMQGKVVKVPERRPNGSVVHNPPLLNQSLHPVTGRNPVMKYMSFSDLFHDLTSAAYVLQHLKSLPPNYERDTQILLLKAAEYGREMTDKQAAKIHQALNATHSVDIQEQKLNIPPLPGQTQGDDDDKEQDVDDQKQDPYSVQRANAKVPYEERNDKIYGMFTNDGIPFPDPGMSLDASWYRKEITLRSGRRKALLSIFQALKNPNVNTSYASFKWRPATIINHIVDGKATIEIWSSSNFQYLPTSTPGGPVGKKN